MLYIVLFLHQTATLNPCLRRTRMLYIVLFLHQTATHLCVLHVECSCISFYSYIKPQLQPTNTIHRCVVYRSIPTSNRNSLLFSRLAVLLYIVLFLHQTATNIFIIVFVCVLYIVLFLHQTATLMLWLTFRASCISFYSYIKPQL